MCRTVIDHLLLLFFNYIICRSKVITRVTCTPGIHFTVLVVAASTMAGHFPGNSRATLIIGGVVQDITLITTTTIMADLLTLLNLASSWHLQFLENRLLATTLQITILWSLITRQF